MSLDRPDYTGSIVIEDIENVTAVVTITGTVTVGTITGTVNVNVENLTLAVTQSGEWSVTITGTVEVSGTVSISGAVNITGTVSISNTVTIEGDVAVTGSVEITNVSIAVTGTVAISGTPSVNIATSSVTLGISIESGLRFLMAVESTVSTSLDTAKSHAATTVTANTDVTSFTVSPTTPTNFVVSAQGVMSASSTMSILRDGVVLASKGVTGTVADVLTYSDDNVPAGLHTYSVQYSQNGAAIVVIAAYGEDGVYSDSFSHSGTTASPLLKYTDANHSTVLSKAITLVDTGTIYITLLHCFTFYTTYPYTITLKRDGATITSWDVTSDGTYSYSFEDANLAAGTYTYTLELGGAYGIFLWYASSMVLHSDTGGPYEVYVTSNLENLNIGLDTRARLQPWYQPNFTTVNKSYSDAGVGPHGGTNRWTYTVPTDRIAMITGISCTMMRDVAPSAAGLWLLFVRIDDEVRMCYLLEIQSAVGVGQRADMGQSFILKAAQVAVGLTADGSTGGSYRFSVGALIMEFDT